VCPGSDSSSVSEPLSTERWSGVMWVKPMRRLLGVLDEPERSARQWKGSNG
jgi:hypothetical protein